MNLVSISEASRWASEYLEREITNSNINYLVQYGKLAKHEKKNKTLVDLDELEQYYEKQYKTKEDNWKAVLGDDLNWHLSFDEFREKYRTKHVHRLHQYKGKFIPQLVEYFLDQHTDEFKTQVYFQPGDVVLDPFCGSGTTIVQANELGMHGIGIDISAFNMLITKVKVQKYDLLKVKRNIDNIIYELEESIPRNLFSDNDRLDHEYHRTVIAFSNSLNERMNDFNHKYFPNAEFKYKVNQGEIDEKSYAEEKEKEFLKLYEELIEEYSITLYTNTSDDFIDKWFMDTIVDEMNFIKRIIENSEDETISDLLKVILSRTIRSCRATTHSDLAFLKDMQTTPYFCRKHHKICVPLYTLKDKFRRYAKDTYKRINQFSKLRQDVDFAAITGDSRNINIFQSVRKMNPDFGSFVRDEKIAGIFTSPPYVGQIDYHEQHAYSYELFDFERRDDKEIGPKYDGKSKKAQEAYVEGISQVLLNCKQDLKTGYSVFIVANDKFDLYPIIAEKAGMKIVQRYKRPVLNRTSRDRNPYAESIFHLKND